MHLLVTNDDGITAPGLQSLVLAIQQTLPAGCTWTVVAPDSQRSECGHSVTNRRPLRIIQHAENYFAVDGTPVDCVRLAIETLLPRIDLVLAGVNDGGNLGVDLLVSGTFAAAREAFLRGISAAAISHVRHPDHPRSWQHVPNWIAAVLEKCWDDCHQQAFLRNINLPADPTIELPKRVACPIDDLPLTVSYQRKHDGSFQTQMDYQQRPRRKGSDVDFCFSGFLTWSECTQPSPALLPE